MPLWQRQEVQEVLRGVGANPLSARRDMREAVQAGEGDGPKPDPILLAACGHGGTTGSPVFFFHGDVSLVGWGGGLGELMREDPC